VNNATTATAVWSEGHNGMVPRAANSTVTLPAQMMTPGIGVIMAETTYHYQSPMSFLFNGTVDFTHTVYRRSRLVDPIPRVP
jgi:hypothetical protein